MDTRKLKGAISVNIIKEKAREIRLRWYGYMQRIEENNEVKAVIEMVVPGNRPRGSPRGRWMDYV